MLAIELKFTARALAMERTPPAVLGLRHALVCSSLLLNALFVAHHLLVVPPSRRLGAGDDGGLSWALEAAREAEAAAAADCSGHGRVFLDGVAGDGEDGRPGCECNACFAGPDCSVRTPDCTADADSGDPMFLEPYWMRHAAASAVVISGWHRMSYRITDGVFQSAELERHIRRLHAAVGNAVAADKHLVFASGSTQLINALVHALSPDTNSGSTAAVVATAPYFPLYRTQTEMFDGREYSWEGTTAAWRNASTTARPANSTTTKENLIEFVASPNNPDALLRGPALAGAGASAIVDHAYYWPHFTHIPEPADEDVMLFTASKLTGHASSRFGWALIRDAAVAERANAYIQQSTMGASRDTQLRMLKILKAVLANLRRGGKDDDDDDIFAFGHGVMRRRWRALSAAMSRSRRISLQRIPPQYCTYFGRIREPSPAYAWVKCEREEDDDCSAMLLGAKMVTRSGVWNEASSRYTRMSLIKSQDDFGVLLERVTELVSAEMYSAAGSNSM